MKSNIFLAIIAAILCIMMYEGCNLRDKSIDYKLPPTENQQTTAPDQNTDKESTPKTENMSAKDIINVSGTQQEQLEQNYYNTQDKRMIIRTGTMSMEVDKYDETESKIKEITKKYSGYITNSNATLNANGKKQGTLTLRIPSEKFDGLLNELRGVGKVMNENINGKDVTEEYMDAEARLKTQQQLEDRLLKLLSEKTAKLTDVVEVEQKLSSVRENIERTQGRLKYLKDQAAYSTLAVSVYEPSLLTTSTGGGFFYELEQGFKKGLNGFTMVLTGIITVVVALLPVLVIVFLIIYFIVRYFKKKHLAAIPVKKEAN